MQQSRRIDAIAIALVGAATLVGVAVWSDLPARMAIHWSGGAPDGYASKPWAIFGTALMGVGSIAAIRLLPARYTSTPGEADVSVLFVGIVIAWVLVVVVGWNLGYRFDVTLAVLPVLVGVAILMMLGTWWRGRG